MDEKKINAAIKKRALGFKVKETVEEFAFNKSGNKELKKRKVTTKHYPPDLPAVKILMAGVRQLEDYTEEELESERLRLMAEIGGRG